MKIYEYSGSELGCGACVAALGFFDGVHLAHRDLIKRAREAADSLGLPCAVFTFRSEGGILKNGARRIYGTEEKLAIFESLGVDLCILADFNAIRGLDAREFIEETVIGHSDVRVAVAGYNFRFGKGAQGDRNMLCELMSAHGLNAIILDEFTYNSRTVSSTAIREMIRDGRIREANELLGQSYTFRAEVKHGRGEGRGLGFPTVNTELPKDREIPRLGVYRTEVLVDGDVYVGITNVGTCPTFAERAAHLETYILGYEGDLYGKTVELRLIDFIRDEKRFDSKDELIMQIKLDINKVIKDSDKAGI